MILIKRISHLQNHNEIHTKNMQPELGVEIVIYRMYRKIIHVNIVSDVLIWPIDKNIHKRLWMVSAGFEETVVKRKDPHNSDNSKGSN